MIMIDETVKDDESVVENEETQELEEESTGEDEVFDFEAADIEESDDLEEAGVTEDVVEASLEGTELQEFEAAEIEEQKEHLDPEQVISILESMLFATDRPQTLASLRQPFRGTNIKSKDVKEALETLTAEYASEQRGVTLEEVTGGYQLRTKVDNMKYLKQLVKIRPFKLSGPALEVLSIIAYKQPCIKAQVDELRGVESGHIVRALMEKGLCSFAGKSEFPGKPMLYQTTRKFLEIFGLRNLKELPSLAEIDQLIPDGIGDEEKKTTLGDLTEKMSEGLTASYSEGEEELEKITGKLVEITTTSDFFEDEKRRQKEKRDAERAQDIREALDVGEEVEAKDRTWFERYEARLAKEAEEAEEAQQVVEDVDEENSNGLAEDSEVVDVKVADTETEEPVVSSVLEGQGVEFKEPGEIGEEIGAVDVEADTASGLANLAAESFSDHFLDESDEAVVGESEDKASDLETLGEVEVEEMNIETYKPHSEPEE